MSCYAVLLGSSGNLRNISAAVYVSLSGCLGGFGSLSRSLSGNRSLGGSLGGNRSLGGSFGGCGSGLCAADGNICTVYGVFHVDIIVVSKVAYISAES